MIKILCVTSEVVDEETRAGSEVNESVTVTETSLASSEVVSTTGEDDR